jgi:hypothetical protein
MIAFPFLLLEPAREAGMKIPNDPYNYNPEEVPHFHVFCILQLGRPMSSPTDHWDNAHIV